MLRTVFKIPLVLYFNPKLNLNHLVFEFKALKYKILSFKSNNFFLLYVYYFKIKFLHFSNPTSETSSIIWHPFATNNGNYLRILAADEIQDIDNPILETSLLNPHPETVTFWDEIYSNHFLDAESNWNLNERDDTATPGTDEDGSTTSEPDDDDSTTPHPDDSPTTEAPDSASTAVGYTFLIMILFSILNKLHLSALVS